jgi:hypothetical protein
MKCHTEVKNAYNICVGKPEGKRPLGRILKCILKKHGVSKWTGFNWLWIGFSGCCCEHLSNLLVP